MDTQLDDALAAAAPPVSERTPAMHDALRHLVLDTKRASAPSPRRGLAVASTASALAALAGAGAAAAAGWVPTPWWESPQATTVQTGTASGQGCAVTYAPRASEVAGHPVSARDRSEAMSAAAAFLRHFDYATLEHVDPVRAQAELEARLDESLAKQGYSVYAVSVASATDCPSGTNQ